MGEMLGGTVGVDNGCLNGRLGLNVIGDNGENMAESENLNISSFVKKALSKAYHQCDVF